jgi:uncharacterized protein YcbK (DUF882 family)
MRGNLSCPCGKCSGVLDSNLLSLLSFIEKAMEKELYITSGYRCPEHNKSVGGTPNSSHLKGLACDISMSSDKDRYILITLLLSGGMNRIGISKTFIHADKDPALNAKRIWVY